MVFPEAWRQRLSRAVLRCFPILLVAVFIPSPYGLGAPANPACFLVFLLTLALGLLNVVAFCMIILYARFYHFAGWHTACSGCLWWSFSRGNHSASFLSRCGEEGDGAVALAAMQNVALRVYSGDLAGPALQRAVILQIFWFSSCWHAVRRWNTGQ